MKVLFAVSNEDISESIVKKYQKEYKQIISSKNVYYFNAILKELQKDKTYDRIVISEDVEAFANTQYDQIDKFIFDKLDSISDEAVNARGADIPIIIICSDRRAKSEEMLVKLFGIGIYNAIIGNDRSVDEVCRLINRPRSKKDAKNYYKIETENVNYQSENENDVSEMEIQNILAHYKRLGKDENKYIDSFNNIAAQYNDIQLRIISQYLPIHVKAVLEEKSPKYQKIMSFNSKVSDKLRKSKNEDSSGPSEKLLRSKTREKIMSNPVVIPSSVNMQGTKKLARAKTKAPIQEIEEEVVLPQVEEIEEETTPPQPPQVEPVKRGRGRPPKKKTAEELEAQKTVVKRGRGRPPKKEKLLETEEIVMPMVDEEPEELIMPMVEEKPEEIVMPMVEEPEELVMPMVEEPEELIMPMMEEAPQNSSSLGESFVPEISKTSFDYEEPRRVENINQYSISNQNDIQEADISELLTQGKKIVTFVGTSKNGTSFIVNNLATLLASNGIDTAILDTTKNKNSYYIYTKNEEELRVIATQMRKQPIKRNS